MKILRPMLYGLLAFLLVLELLSLGGRQLLRWRKNRLPEEVTRALSAPDNAVLYSLDPSLPILDDLKKLALREGDIREKFHRFATLGHLDLDQEQTATAVHEFEAAVAGWTGPGRSACFEPRHALRVTAGGHTYDLLLCYECGGMEVYRDDRLIADLGARGSPKVLNGILTGGHVPLATQPAE